VSEYRYATRSLLADDVKAALGLTISIGPLFLDDLSRVALYVFSVLALLFGIFAIRTAARHTRVIELSDTGIRARGLFARGFGWEELKRVQLRYYSTRRDRERGWMSLKVSDGRSTIVIDSSIYGFQDIAGRIALEARRRDVEFSPLTQTNLAAMGINAD